VSEQPLSLNEWVCLALLTEKSSHGFALAKQLAPESDLGRILTVRRPLVYRALDRLVAADLVHPQQVEPGAAGPTRTVLGPSAPAKRSVTRWLNTPVNHVRDLRVEFLLKLRLLERRGRTPQRLIERQRSVLGETLDSLIERPAGPGEADVVDLWRANNAQAAHDFFEQLNNRGP
jgi:PadR family transcriptional regulator AphA